MENTKYERDEIEYRAGRIQRTREGDTAQAGGPAGGEPARARALGSAVFVLRAN